MRLNKFLALNTKLSRRKADEAIESGLVIVNNQVAKMGQIVSDVDNVTYGGRTFKTVEKTNTTFLLNKPRGFVCSRNGQGSKTIYSLLPPELHNLNPVGRLDKDSSGLLIMTNDGDLANNLTHPSKKKEKVYEVELDKPLVLHDQISISETGIKLTDGHSRLALTSLSPDRLKWQITMHEGRNRQIRRTFSELKYITISLHRIRLDKYKLDNLPMGKWCAVQNQETANKS